MTGMGLVDFRGDPVSTAVLDDEIAATTVTGLRSIFEDSIATGLTPSRLGAILRTANNGENIRDYLVLAEEMEERDSHYFSLLQTRKRSITGLETAVQAASEDTKDVMMAEEVAKLGKLPSFGSMLFNSLDALGKSFAVNEIMWDRSGALWKPREYKWRDARFFTFDRDTATKLMLLDEEEPSRGIPLEPFKFVQHIPQLKTGIPIRGGLARIIALLHIFKAYALKDWMAFVEVFGMPIRIGRFEKGDSNEKDIRALKTALRKLGTDAAAVIPRSTQIEFIEAKSRMAGEGPFDGIANWLNKEESKAVLGQTMTSEDGASLSQSQIHNEVRKDIRDADARQLEETINRDVIKPFIDLNFGPQEVYPEWQVITKDPEDLEKLSKGLGPFIKLGLTVPMAWVREKFQAPEPKDGEEVLGGAPAPANTPPPPGAGDGGEDEDEDDESGGGSSNRGEASGERNRNDVLDDLADELNGEWRRVLSPLVEPIQKLANESANFTEFRKGLSKVLAKANAEALVDDLATRMFTSRGVGDATDSIT